MSLPDSLLPHERQEYPVDFHRAGEREPGPHVAAVADVGALGLGPPYLINLP